VSVHANRLVQRIELAPLSKDASGAKPTFYYKLTLVPLNIRQPTFTAPITNSFNPLFVIFL